ncbi:hypothetical protein CDAR_102471 [Caerostris darwini]|uniref:Uncharacterized protein n=1 Tax=Caerostris darwini TaxID=1538125 RepID=A0AAV4R3B7_9ARAC|nr:hypothetical protein CDAR_102471 [Caerostris darwini]
MSDDSKTSVYHGGFALRVERSFEVASPNADVIFQADSNAVEGIKNGFTKILDLVLKQLEHVNTRIDELDKQKDIPENSYKNQPPSQRRDRNPSNVSIVGVWVI